MVISENNLDLVRRAYFSQSESIFKGSAIDVLCHVETTILNGVRMLQLKLFYKTRKYSLKVSFNYEFSKGTFIS
jgi:hypothetical protein